MHKQHFPTKPKLSENSTVIFLGMGAINSPTHLTTTPLAGAQTGAQNLAKPVFEKKGFLHILLEVKIVILHRSSHAKFNIFL